MANGQEEFVHPIISAMQNAFEQIQGAKKQKFDQALNTREADLRDQQFQELQKEHDRAEKHAQEQHDINIKTLELTGRQHALDLTKQVGDFIQSGGQGIPDMIPGVMSQIAPGVPGAKTPDVESGRLRIPNSDITYDPRGYSSPEDNYARQAKAMADQAGAVTNAQQTAEAPFKAKERTDLYNQQKSLADETFSRNLLVAQNNRRSAERIAAQKDATERYLGELNARTRLALAKNGLDANDPAIDSYVNDMYLAGNTDKIPSSAKVQNAVRSAIPTGWTPLQKTDKEQLSGIPLLDELAAKSKLLAEQGSGFMGKAGILLGRGQAANTSQEVEALLGNVARVFGGEKGVLTQKDVDRAKGLIYDIRQGKDENGQKAEELKGIYTRKIASSLAKYPEDQRQSILAKWGVDPNRFDTGKRTAIELNDGTRIPDTPENRKLHNLPPQ